MVPEETLLCHAADRVVKYFGRWSQDAPWMNSDGIAFSAPTRARSTGCGCAAAQPRAAPGPATCAGGPAGPRAAVKSVALGDALGEGGGVKRSGASPAGSQCWNALQKASKKARSAAWSPCVRQRCLTGQARCCIEAHAFTAERTCCVQTAPLRASLNANAKRNARC